MKLVYILIIFFITLSLGSAAQKSSIEKTPHRINLNLTETPYNSMAVSWRSNERINQPAVEVAVSSDWTEFDTLAISVNATCVNFIIENNIEVYQYSAIMNELEPNTLYAYRVGGDSIWSEWNQFTTANEGKLPFTFTYIGDIQHDIKDLGSRLIRKAFTVSPESSFWIYTGDVVDKAEFDYQWEEYFQAAGFINSTIPSVFVAGNHEYIDTVINGQEEDILAELWRVQINQPKGSIPGMEETVFYFDYQGVRFVVLNGNERLDEQSAWLEKILSDNNNKWTIVALHQPIYSMSKGRNQKNTRNAFLAIFDKYNVDIVLQGHDHVYARTGKMKNNLIVMPEQKGTIYITSNAGSDEYTPRSVNTQYAQKIGNKVQLFQTITINDNTLDYKSFSVTGKLFDTYKIVK